MAAPRHDPEKFEPNLDPWLDQGRASLVASFADGAIKDKAVVDAAIHLPWSNGQTEDQITKLKLVKRQMYGRGKLEAPLVANDNLPVDQA